MKRDRDGEVLEEDELPLPRHNCRNGWKGEGDDGRPVPCLECRPHLVDRLKRTERR